MPQQINLFHPVLLAPRQHFPALAMVQALGLRLLALALISGWSVWRTQSLHSELAAADRARAAERAQLEQALAARHAAQGDPAALAQELALAEARLAERARVLDALGGDTDDRPSALLRRLARTVPPPVWLHELRWAPGRVEIAGQTLQPEVLQPWLARLAPGTAAGPQRADAGARPSALALRVEQRDAGTGGWAFRISDQAHGADAPGASR